MAAAMGRKMRMGSQAASVGRSRLKPPRDWQASVTAENDTATTRQMPIEQAAGRSFATIEGLGAERLHPLQQAWLDEDVAQCGFCQPGMIMTAAAMLADNPSPTDAEIDEVMADSVCRCGTYNRMREAIRRAAGELRRR